MVLYIKCSNLNAFFIGLFNVPLQQLMERRIRPWINKKIIEYIGEPEPTLVDFICSKVLAGSAPQGILDDVQMVSCDFGEE
jgi:RNA-binding protein 25